MDDSFDNRQKSFEAKFAHDEDRRFRTEARACKLLGLRIARLLDMDEEHAQAYASSLATVNLDEPGFADVLSRVKEDLSAKGLSFSDHMLERQMEECLDEAEAAVAGEAEKDA